MKTRSESLEVPVLDETTCTGCGLCAAVCPVDCLAMRGAVPWLVRPGDCVGCSVCVLACPASSLHMVNPRERTALQS